MLELGKYQMLEVIKKTEHGIYLAENKEESNHSILLPSREVPEETATGDKLNVFLYKDSEDREIATTAKVPLTIGDFAFLKVKEVGNIGAFLDWGLMKDLLLPYKEQTKKLEEGDMVLVSLYVDRSNRLCATMKVYDLLLNNSAYKKNDMVNGTVYEEIDSFGVFVAVDNKYSAMIPKNELFAPLKIGDVVHARVINIRPDGKLTLSLREKSYVQMDADSELILNKLETSGGFLSFNDNSAPEDIKEEFKMSKNAFKRAIGRLYKEGAITITDQGIRII